MTEQEALKINGLYTELDTLKLENTRLKGQAKQDHNKLLERLEVIEGKLDAHCECHHGGSK